MILQLLTHDVYMGVSENSGFFSKSSILIGFPIIFTIHFGSPPLFLETPILRMRLDPTSCNGLISLTEYGLHMPSNLPTSSTVVNCRLKTSSPDHPEVFSYRHPNILISCEDRCLNPANISPEKVFRAYQTPTHSNWDASPCFPNNSHHTDDLHVL